MAKPKKNKRTVAYLRVSTIDQDIEKFKSDILRLANGRDFGRVEFVEEKVSGKKSWKERKIKKIIDELSEGDRLIVPELSRLGRSMLEIMEILSIAKEREISIYAVKGDWHLNSSIGSKIIGMVFAMASEIERDLISQRTKEGLRARKAAGVKLGRPKGPGKSKLDKNREEIVALLKNGSTKAYIARRYGSSQNNLYNWIKKNKIVVMPIATLEKFDK